MTASDDTSSSVADINLIAFTAEQAAVSVLLSPGMVPIAETNTSTTYGELVDDTDDPSIGHRSLTIRRWRTDTPHRPSTETVAALALHDSPLSRDWTGPASPTTVDGAPATTRPFREHDGVVGAVVTCDLIDSVVTLRATWHPDDHEGATALITSTGTARLLAVSDLVVDRSSLYHPLLGVSFEIPLGWVVSKAEPDHLTMSRGSTTITLSRSVEVPNSAGPEPINITSVAPLQFTATADTNPLTCLTAVSNDDEHLIVRAEHVDDVTRSDMITFINTIRTHPR